MAKLHVSFEDQREDEIIEFDPKRAPFHHDGEPGSVLDILLGHGVELEHACGGNCACTTCHIIVLGGMEYLSGNEEEEDDMLDRAPGLTSTSRLGCQAIVCSGEVKIIIPRYTINQQM